MLVNGREEGGGGGGGGGLVHTKSYDTNYHCIGETQRHSEIDLPASSYFKTQEGRDGRAPGLQFVA